jgi:PEP-CTERM motif
MKTLMIPLWTVILGQALQAMPQPQPVPVNVPEPSTGIMLVVGICAVGIGVIGQRRRKNS